MSKYELDIKHFSKTLKYLIKKNNIKNIDLANYLGLSKGAISNYVSGKYKPQTETILKIASYFDVNLENLISKKRINGKAPMGEPGEFVYDIPVFHRDLIYDKIIYRNDNYIGPITSPLPADSDAECYAVMIYDNSMKKFGMVKQSLAIFSASSEVKNGDIAAVFIKSKKQIFVRSVKYEKKKIILISDNDTEEYSITKDGCDAIVLGKIIHATFNPNSR